MATVALGADHAGFALKEALKGWLAGRGHGVLDLGTASTDSVDYPDFAVEVARAVASGTVQRGVLVCGTGIGMAITANKVPGVRAALCDSVYTARLSREHNDANVLCLGGRLTGPEMAQDILAVWLDAAFAGGRHERRVGKIALAERSHGGAIREACRA